MEKQLASLVKLSGKQYGITDVDVRQMIKDISHVFNQALLAEDHDKRSILRITTKLRDAGRRSPPWTPASSVVPGRPQDGADGNRRLRWLFAETHKFYAHEVDATLTEVKYYLQLLSMTNAPSLPTNTIQNCFSWLIEHPVEPNTYRDPIQVIPINLVDVLADARCIQSGHLIPLDRGGRHEAKNAFLMLARSNQLQGNLTVAELLQLMEAIVTRHKENGVIKTLVTPD